MNRIQALLSRRNLLASEVPNERQCTIHIEYIQTRSYTYSIDMYSLGWRSLLVNRIIYVSYRIYDLSCDKLHFVDTVLYIIDIVIQNLQKFF